MEIWQQAEGIQRPEACCSVCPRRIQPTGTKKLLIKLGIARPEQIDNTCSGPEDYITTSAYLCTPGEPSVSPVSIVSTSDCPKVYPCDSTAWNIAWLNNTATERQQ